MKKIIITLILIVALAAGWYLGSPLFLNKEIDEDLPFDLSELQDNEMPDSMSLDAMDALLDMPSDEELSEMSDEEKQAMEDKLQDMVDQMPPVISEEEMPSGPTLLKQANFRDGDSFHKGSGLAKLVSLEDGSNLLRLQDFNVTNGPDLFVYLTKNGNPQDSDDVHEGFYDLGRLKGNIGNQNYVIPAGVDVSEYNSVIIYCRAFSVLFAVASF